MGVNIDNEIKKAASILNNGDVVAIPTETVYGLAGNAFNEAAIKKIFEAKNRPFYNPLIVHIKSINELDAVAKNIPPLALELASTFWPGPLTLVLEKQDCVSDLVTGGKDTVAVRVPRHPVALALLNELSFPLVAPSANPFNYLSPTCAEHVQEQLGEKIPMILDGGSCQKGVESTIISFKDKHPIVLRYGAVSIEDIESVCGKLEVLNHNNKTPDAPGMLKKHYSPTTHFCLTHNVLTTLDSFSDKKIGILAFSKAITDNRVKSQIVLSEKGDLNEAASKLFSAMHDLDKMDLDIIIAAYFPEEGLGKTINDRLKRAHNV